MTPGSHRPPQREAFPAAPPPRKAAALRRSQPPLRSADPPAQGSGGPGPRAPWSADRTTRDIQRCESWGVAEGDGRVSVATGAVAIELDIGPVLDRKNASERVLAEVRDQPRGMISRIGWVGKHNVKGLVRQPLGEPQGIAAVYGDGSSHTQGCHVGIER